MRKKRLTTGCLAFSQEKHGYRLVSARYALNLIPEVFPFETLAKLAVGRATFHAVVYLLSLALTLKDSNPRPACCHSSTSDPNPESLSSTASYRLSPEQCMFDTRNCLK
ncbi:hypothetical protein MLD38_012297 [Melastoma candidum]|uniref:Uncharacterized protein n=1 Tax=Melastoma candidum TaxID=119954 RepID=A0ACB9R8W4_9MYRT|nr:hypothetical protein MLD38_012297 [Melastoma candidum]